MDDVKFLKLIFSSIMYFTKKCNLIPKNTRKILKDKKENVEKIKSENIKLRENLEKIKHEKLLLIKKIEKIGKSDEQIQDIHHSIKNFDTKISHQTHLLNGNNNYLLESIREIINESGNNSQEHIYKGRTISIWDATTHNYLPGVKFYHLKDPLCINEKDQHNYYLTPLHIASDLGYFQIVKYLVDNGADLEALSLTKETPLTKACFKGHLSIANYLLNHGANVNHRNSQKETSLHLAIKNNHLSLVILLIQNNAKQSLRNYTNSTPLDVAKSGRKLEIINILKSKNK